jgi:actin-related protein 8
LAILQVFEDLRAIWDWILIEKLHIPRNERNMYSAILVLPETFDNRGILNFIPSKPMLHI